MNSVNKTQYFIFTDMDGTLLDHSTYSHEPADKMLQHLRQSNIPVIPTTSKTYAELILLRQQIGLDGPFIIENGAAIYIPVNFLRYQPEQTQLKNGFWVRQFTSPKSHWLKLLSKVSPDFKGCFEQFSTMTIGQICEATGLTEENAKLAAQRQFGEPILWLGSQSQKEQFVAALKEAGAAPLEGGRFIHASGDCDKGIALNWLMQQFRLQQPDTEAISIALGDSQNDIAMLESADIAVRILSPSHPPPELKRTDRIYTSTLQGPAGWNETLSQILQPS